MEGRPRRGGWLVGLGLLLTLALVGGALFLQQAGSRQPAFPIYGQVADFTLTNQMGEVTSRGSLLGRIWVADIIFTRCAGPCPKLTASLAELNRGLSDLPSLALVSLTADPEYDTPPVLRRYGENFGAAPGRWAFLTGSREAIYQLAVESLRLVVVEKKEGEREDPSDLFLHSTLLVLVDRQGRIRGYYEGLEQEALTKLAGAVRRLAKEG